MGVSSEAAGDRLVPALMEGLGFFAVGFFGSEALFAPGADGIPLAATLVPGVAAGVAAFTHRLRNPFAEARALCEDHAPPPGIRELEPRAPAPRREAA